MNTKNLCEEEITLAPQTEIFEEAKRIAAESAGDATDSFVMKYDANQKAFLIAVLTELGCMITAEKDETNTMTATMNMEQAKFLIDLECVKNIHKVLIRNHLEEEILAARAAEKEESAASAATPMMLSANEEEGVAVASVQTVAETAGSSMATAISLPLESWVDGCVCCPENDWIWYKFTVPSDAENTTYTVHTYGSLNMIGALCNSGGTVLASDNDGIKCKMVANLTKGATYYVKLKAYYQGETGGVHVRATTKTIVDSLSVVPQTIVLKTGVTYELPITIGEYSSQTENTYPLAPITVSASPVSPTETRVFWGGTGQSNPIQVVDGFYEIRKDEYNKYTTVRSDVAASTTLYVYDWYQYGIRGTVNVIFSDQIGQVVRVNANNGLDLWESVGGTGNLLGMLEDGAVIGFMDQSPVNEKWCHVYGAMADGSVREGWCSGYYLEESISAVRVIEDCYVRTSTTISNSSILRTSSGASVVLRKNYYDKVRLLQKNIVSDSSDDNKENETTWHKIEYDGEEAYVTANSFTYSWIWQPLIKNCNCGAGLTPIAIDDYITPNNRANNAQIIYGYLYNKGWTKNAICAVLGNMQAESDINPGFTQRSQTGQKLNAYGLVQWDAIKSDMEDYMDENGKNYDDLYGQLDCLDYQCMNGSEYWNQGSGYPDDLPFISFHSFKKISDLSIESLTRIFLWAFEKAGTPAEQTRINYANDWYDYIKSLGF